MVFLIVTMGENNIQLTIQFRVSLRIIRRGGEKLDYPNIMGRGEGEGTPSALRAPLRGI